MTSPPTVPLFIDPHRVPLGLLIDAAADALRDLGLAITARLVRDTVPGEYRCAAIAEARADLALVRETLDRAGVHPWVLACDHVELLLATAALRCALPSCETMSQGVAS